jgi:hypothetical protein
MPRPSVSPDLIGSHYTRVPGTGETAAPARKALWGRRMQPPHQPQETIMTRIIMTVSVLALAISTAQAGTSDQLAARIHDAAVAACAPERATGALPQAHYGSINDNCVYRISQSAMNKYQALAKAAESSKLANK